MMFKTTTSGRSERRDRRRLAGALRDRRILITGASSGIGRALALQIGDAGADAILVARRADELEKVAKELTRRGGRARFHSTDLADVQESHDLAAAILRDHGPVDVIVHDAGRSIRRPIVDCKAEDFRALAAVNYLGPLALTLGLLPPMLERGRGHLIQVSTIGVQTDAPNFAGYVAARAAADHFAHTLRLELHSQGIDVTTIQMPLVRTAMMAPSPIYRAFPSLGVEQAARRIGWAVIRRPLRGAPRWTTFLEVSNAVIPGVVQWAFDRAHEPVHEHMHRRLARMQPPFGDPE